MTNEFAPALYDTTVPLMLNPTRGVCLQRLDLVWLLPCGARDLPCSPLGPLAATPAGTARAATQAMAAMFLRVFTFTPNASARRRLGISPGSCRSSLNCGLFGSFQAARRTRNTPACPPSAERSTQPRQPSHSGREPAAYRGTFPRRGRPGWRE